MLRYKVLDSCFRNPGKKYFIDDLITACNIVLEEIAQRANSISRRQIFDDIRFMESAEGWNIDLLRIKQGKRVYYRYREMSYSINNMPFNEVEINYVLATLGVLEQFKGLPQFPFIKDLLSRLTSNPMANRGELIVDFDANQYLKGIEHLGEIYNAIHYKKTLRIYYQSFTDTLETELIFHPYYLKQYNGRWFVFGFNPETQRSDWNLALDRIISIGEVDENYIINTVIDWEEYFEDIIGVTKPTDGKAQKIILLFYGITGKYIESKPIHGSQKSKWVEPTVLQVELDVIVNFELERLILSYCDTLKIIEPLDLRERISKRILKAEENFEY